MPTNPPLPTMLYDGDCGFCQKWIEKWNQMTLGKVHYTTYQTSLQQFPQITEVQCKEAVQLLMPDGQRLSGAHAVLHALALACRYRTLLWMYEHTPPFAWAAEALYQWVAHHRAALSRHPSQRCRLP